MKRKIIFLISMLCIVRIFCTQAVILTDALQSLRSKLVDLAGVLGKRSVTGAAEEWLKLLQSDIYVYVCEDKKGNDVKVKRTNDLQKIFQLGLPGNELTEIPNLSALKNLEWLYLDENNLKTVPGLSTLKNLKWLYLSRNDLTEIPNLSALKKLELLDLSGNPITEEAKRSIEKQPQDFKGPLKIYW